MSRPRSGSRLSPSTLRRWALLPVLTALVSTSGCGTSAPSPADQTTSVTLERLQRVEVVRTVDGDTVHVRFEEPGPAGRQGAEVSARLLEIDAPESVKPDSPVECFGPEASRALEHLVPAGTTAWVEPDRDLLDRYGRTLLYLYVDRAGAPVMVNAELVRRGFAEAVLFEPNDRHIDDMRAAQAEARRGRRGLWGAC